MPPLTGAELLAGLLRQEAAGPVEESGATAIFEAISGSRVQAEVLARDAVQLTPDEHYLLDAGDMYTGHRRWCLLRTETGVPVAETTAVLLPLLIPLSARVALGMSREGEPLGPHTLVPLGKALHGLGVIREPREVRLTPCYLDAAGEVQVMYSEALLRGPDGPVALVTERITQAFLDMFPGPWPAASSLAAGATV